MFVVVQRGSFADSALKTTFKTIAKHRRTIFRRRSLDATSFAGSRNGAAPLLVQKTYSRGWSSAVADTWRCIYTTLRRCRQQSRQFARDEVPPTGPEEDGLPLAVAQRRTGGSDKLLNWRQIGPNDPRKQSAPGAPSSHSPSVQLTDVGQLFRRTAAWFCSVRPTVWKREINSA